MSVDLDLEQMRQILEKIHEKPIDTYHLLLDYKADFDNPIREKLYKAMSKIGIPVKLVRLSRMTLTNTKSREKAGKDHRSFQYQSTL